MARLDESLAMIRKSQELDPLSLIINRNWARMLFFARRYDEAIEQADKVLEMDPNFVPIHALLANVYEEKRMYPEAISEHGKTLELLGEQGLAKSQERVYSSTGWSGVLRWRLDQAQNSAKNKHGFSVYVAAAYADLGDREKAISWLQRAYEQHDYFLVFLQVSPTWDILRSDSRFKELVRKVGLPPVFASNVEYHAPRAPR